MNRILYIAPDLRGKSGGSYACLAYYNALCAAFPGKVDAAIGEEYCVGIDSDKIPVPRRSKLKALLSGSIHRYKAFINNYLKQNYSKYSLCIINFSMYAGDMMDIIHSYGIKIVVIHHNFEREYHLTTKSSLTFGGRIPFFIERNERNAYHKADLNLFLTERDMDEVDRFYGKTEAMCKILGIFETRRVEYTQFLKRKDLTIVITGGLSDYQTYNSILLFEKYYFKHLKNEYPNIKIIIAGRNPVKSILSFSEKYPQNIKVIANPDDMNSVLEKGNIYLCPTCTGSGLKLRIMDGLRKGLPILVHNVSSRGYEPFYLKPYFRVYNDIDTFMNGLKTIIKEVVESGNDYNRIIFEDYIKIYGFECGVRNIKNLLQEIL